LHLAAAGHARSRPGRLPHTAFLATVGERWDRTIADIGAEHGLSPEAAKRAAARAGIFRRGRLESTLRRDEQIVRRAAEGITRRQVANEFGLSLSHIYYVLRLARHDHGGRPR
jgi:hypothetical protein